MSKTDSSDTQVPDLKVIFRTNYTLDTHIMTAFRKCVTDLIQYHFIYSDDYIASLQFHLQNELFFFQKGLHMDNVFLSVKKTPKSNTFIISTTRKDQTNDNGHENLVVCKVNLYQDTNTILLKDFDLLREIKDHYNIQRVYYFVFLDDGIDLPLLHLIINRLYFRYRLLLVKKNFQWVKDYVRLCVYSIKDNTRQEVLFYSHSIMKRTFPIIVY